MTECGIILLAAGASTRLKQAKQLLPYQGKNLLQHSMETALAASVSSVMVVLGAYNGPLLEPHHERLEILVNNQWKEGIASSIRNGLSVFLANHPDTDSIILMVCDQPFVSGNLLNELMITGHQENKEIVACSYGNTVGTPVLFKKRYFGELSALRGDEGAKKIVMRHMDEVAVISFPKGDIDIDTPEDYQFLLQSLT